MQMISWGYRKHPKNCKNKAILQKQSEKALEYTTVVLRAELEYTWYYCSIESRTRNVPTQKKSGREKVEMAVQNVRGMPKKRLPAIAALYGRK